jgi:hypothetical protein
MRSFIFQLLTGADQKFGLHKSGVLPNSRLELTKEKKLWKDFQTRLELYFAACCDQENHKEGTREQQGATRHRKRARG